MRNEVRRICCAWSIERLRDATDEAYIMKQYTILRTNASSFSCANVVDILRCIYPFVSTYALDHLMALRRHVEFDGTILTEGRLPPDTPFNPTKHVVHVAGPSHLDHLTRESPLGATVRHGCNGGVLVWWKS